MMRPKKFSEIIGQKEVCNMLETATNAAVARQEPLSHLLLSGPPGLGKTTIAGVISKMMGTRMHVILGPTVSSTLDVLRTVMALKPHDILFVDEIHRLPAKAQESLYSVMEDSRVSIQVEGVTEPVVFDIQPFTLIGATTHIGLLSAPFLARFPLQFVLCAYSPEELAQILQRQMREWRMMISSAASNYLASVSRNNPRRGLNLLRLVRDYTGGLMLGLAEVTRIIRQYGIDSLGLDEQDRTYLQTLRNGPVGIDALAQIISTPRETLEYHVEPYLIQLELVSRGGSRGRELTKQGRDHSDRSS